MRLREILVDTNVLLRLGDGAQQSSQEVHDSLAKLQSLGFYLCYTAQNVCEYWNVCTRPAEVNGLGLSGQETERRLSALRSGFRLLESTEKAEELLVHLLTERSVRGVQVHDCHLVAVMLALDIEAILTLNPKDFARYTDLVRVLHPSEVLASGFDLAVPFL